MNYLNKRLCSLLLAMLPFAAALQAQRNFNPIIPDFVADPSISKFGDTYYLYGTTDIDHGLAEMGPPVVWKSKDFVNWSFEGTLVPQIDWNKPYTYTDDKGNEKKGYFRYWAPGRAVQRGNLYYLFPTIVSPDGTCPVYTMVADRPEGPFRFQNGDGIFFRDTIPGKIPTTPLLPDIDAEPFIDEDGAIYMPYRRRLGIRVNEDFSKTIGDTFTFPTKRGGYSEGPTLFKRKGIYYYVYTLSGNQNYCNAYMMSKESPISGYYAPEGKDIFIYSSISNGVWGPGHGNVFYDEKSDTYVFAYLEYGEGGTTRQVFANKMEFNPDGTIQTMIPDSIGVGYLNNYVSNTSNARINLALRATASASSSREARTRDVKIETSPNNPQPDGGSVQEASRTFTYLPQNAIDGSNGSRWEAAKEDSTPYFILDFQRKLTLQSCEMCFTLPTFGHAWVLEKSLDGKEWTVCATQDIPAIRSPHIVTGIGKARYLRLKITQGNPGLWEMKVFAR